MNKLLTAGLLVLIGLLAGLFVGNRWYHEPTSADQRTAGSEPLYWVAPMDPNYRRDQPGKSPMGMDLIPVYADADTRAAGTVRISADVVNNLGVRTELSRSRAALMSRRSSRLRASSSSSWALTSCGE